MWYLEVLVFAFFLPFVARSYQNKILLRPSHRSLALSLIWLGIQLATPLRPSDSVVLYTWLFIYALGSLVLVYGQTTLNKNRTEEEKDKSGSIDNTPT